MTTATARGQGAARNPAPENAVVLRPDGMLVIDGRADADGKATLALLKGKPADDAAPALGWLRRLASDHLRRLVAASEDEGAAPPSATWDTCRPDASRTDAILATVPPMPGGEYWTAGALDAFFARLEGAVAALAAKHGGDLLAAVAALGGGWRDIGKVSLHLAENKGDASGERPFAFLATFVSRADGEGLARHLPLSAALKAYAAAPAALKRILAPLEAAAKEDRFLRSLLESQRVFRPCALSLAEAHAFLQGIAAYERAGLLVRTGKIWAKAPPRVKVRVSVGGAKDGGLSATALCQFDVAVTLDGDPLTQKELATLTHAGEGLVRIRGQWVEADHAKLAAILAQWQEMKKLMGPGLTMAQALRLLAGGDADFLAPAARDDDACEVRPTGTLRELLSALTAPAAAATDIPPALRGILRPYQQDGVEYLRRALDAGLGACLADDMGLGKTLQVLTLLAIWKARGELKPLPALVVMPASLIANWKAEAARFTPELRVGVLHPSDPGFRALPPEKRESKAWLKRFDLALTTYGQFARLEKLRAIPFAAVIADEAQAIKNPLAAQSKALRATASPRRLALTGTPVENRLTDLWSIFDFINPGLLGGLSAFMAATEKAKDYSVARRLTRPFILRRLKTDKAIVADLPDKTEINVSTALSRQQAALYERAVNELRHALEDTQDAPQGMRRKGLVLAYMLHLKQICDHPALYLGTDAFRPEDSGKFTVLGERAAEVAARQEKMLVFTQFREMTAPLADYLADVFGREGLIMHGGTPVATRGKLVKAFQDPGGPPFFVLSLKAGGTGLNLTAANHVVHFDRWWNPAVENQASDRAYRIGQKRNVLIHKFVTRGTLEDKIDELIKEKMALADSLFADGGEKLITEMSDAELLGLVRLDAEHSTF